MVVLPSGAKYSTLVVPLLRLLMSSHALLPWPRVIGFPFSS